MNMLPQRAGRLASNRLQGRELIRVIALVVCVVDCAVVVVLLTRIDSLFNGGIFVFSELQSYLDLSFVLLALSMFSGVFAVVTVFAKKTAVGQETHAELKGEPEVLNAHEELAYQEKPDAGVSLGSNVGASNDVAVLASLGKEAEDEVVCVTCPKCGKVSGKPSVRLDLQGSKPLLENVCPQCNSVLGESASDEGMSQS